MLHRAAFAAPVALVLALLAGCATDPPLPGEQRDAASTPSVAESSQARDATSTPGLALTIPALGVRSDLVELGLNADRTVQVPPVDDPGQVGWYRLGPRPGAVGPAVLLAHVNGRDADGKATPGAFARLDQLARGNRIEITTPDGPRAFVVTEVSTVDKGDFPTSKVYADTDDPELRLITCGGVFDAATRNYESNVIVYARAA